MARGWESKSVESQIEERAAARDVEQSRQSDADIERRQKRESLELSRRRIAHELESARSDVHRTALEHALRHLDAELAKLA